MDDSTREMIYDMSADRIRETDCSFHRYLYAQIDWTVRVLALGGPRGVGKTTMFLQHLKENPDLASHALYVSMDNLWLDSKEMYDLVKYHVQHGGTSVFIDEVHYLPDWQRLVKNLYDNFKELRIAYTGSSILRLDEGKGDLSRRQVEYMLQGLSFREYLNLENGSDYKSYTLVDLVKNHVQYAEEITQGLKVLPLFEQYLKGGYYPFYREDRAHYGQRLQQVVNQVLDGDIPKVEDVTPETVRKARRMLSILSASTPQTPNITMLCRNLGMDRKQGIKVLYAMRRAGLLGLLTEDADALKHLGAPSKMYCDNTNLMYVLCAAPDKGTVRETFFNNQLRLAGVPTYPKRGDFLIDGKYLFEVGGAHKTFSQIKDGADAFLAIDDTEIGRASRIPLWMFGFLY